LWDLTAGKERHVLKGHKDVVTSVAFARDGKLLASGSFDTTVKLWDCATGKEHKTLQGHRSRVYAVAFSPDGKTVASGTEALTEPLVQGEIRLWDVVKGETRNELHHDPNTISSLAFSADGKLLAATLGDGTLRLWDPATPQALAVYQAHAAWVTSVAFSP